MKENDQGKMNWFKNMENIFSVGIIGNTDICDNLQVIEWTIMEASKDNIILFLYK